MNQPKLVAWGEAILIRHFQPVWCSIISGFGIHAPGKGRGAQMRSMWDEIHPGRLFAEQLPPNLVTIANLQPRVTLPEYVCAFGMPNGGVGRCRMKGWQKYSSNINNPSC
ncbi:Eco29kI family restriction endonuclease [Nostoc mirabile]|uniref:Eco29kI family restriction endonuclease n=1 Tax=Nostoc mirabile TaxID=2907820 RepID=UPI001E5C7467|nr:Eco29kI family restriction endonuclease [Nostoc mirabile]